ncbi:regulation of nuclear pre-mRNA domain-containing protein 1B-like isoform X2 [Uloborus diversus]|uniref:regulation of nuclear pre-mRNA domain-containing protein 1B-like isoform X2 n=1 Tax=Uloborus diversus TaxID=327109 RepID=UPI00240985A8|nr:regulation of nuclear pre-mRNA domain-containing protein 1B-like isoform X2 [Uloborus diversus]
MSSFTDSALEKKLAELNNSQQSIQTLSLWLIHHRKHHKTIVQVWLRELKKANDVIQNSKKKGPEFSKEFSTVLSEAFAHVYECVSDPKTKSGLDRIIKVWADRNIYDGTVISSLRASMQDKKSPSSKPKVIETKSAKKRKSEKKVKSFDAEPAPKKKPVVKDDTEISSTSPSTTPPDADVLIKTLLDLENCPSADAVVREKIASLPPEVSDASLLEKVQTREAGEKLSKQVEEACTMLAEYNNRLTEELEERKEVSKMLGDFTRFQREQVTKSEQKIEEFKEILKRVSQVRNDLKSHLQNLPDLTLLPSVTGGLAPLPSAGDLFG